MRKPCKNSAPKLTNVDSRVLFADANTAEAMDYLASIGINLVLPVVLNRGLYALSERIDATAF